MTNIFYLIRTPVSKLYLVYFAMSFAAGIQVNYASKIFEDDLNTNPNNNYMDISKGERSKNVEMHFSGLIISVVMLALKKVHRQVAYWLLEGGSKIHEYFFLISQFKLNLVTQTLQPLLQ